MLLNLYSHPVTSVEISCLSHFVNTLFTITVGDVRSKIWLVCFQMTKTVQFRINVLISRMNVNMKFTSCLWKLKFCNVYAVLWQNKLIPRHGFITAQSYQYQMSTVSVTIAIWSLHSFMKLVIICYLNFSNITGQNGLNITWTFILRRFYTNGKNLAILANTGCWINIVVYNKLAHWWKIWIVLHVLP
jgi:hypothetical protein